MGHIIRRHLPKWVILTLIFPLLVGCWDRREIEDRASVSAVAIDAAKDGKVEVSVQIPIPSQIVGGGGGGEEQGGGKGPSGPFMLLSEVGDTYTEAMSKITNASNAPIFFGNMQMLLIGEEQARKGINPILDVLRRTSDIRRQLYPVVIKGKKAKEALNIKVSAEQIPTNYIRDMLQSGIKNGIFADITLGQLLIDMGNPNCQFPILNYIEPVENSFRWAGIAAFNRDKMVADIHPRESVTQILQIRTKQRGRVVLLPRTGGYITFRPYRAARDIQINPDGSIFVNVKVVGSIQEKTSDDDLSKVEVLEGITKQVESTYNSMADQLLQRSQKEFKADIFNIGDYVRAYHPGLYQSMNWQEDYPNVPITIRYDVTIQRYGISAR